MLRRRIDKYKYLKNHTKTQKRFHKRLLSNLSIQKLLCENHEILNDFNYVTYAANNPIEDRYIYDEKRGYYGVFDGHGGYQAADYCSKHILSYINDDIEYNKRFNNAFISLDENFLNKSYKNEDYRSGLSGACGLICHITNNNINIANVGDCRAIIGRKLNENYQMKVISLTNDHTVENINERRRLLREHPDEDDILGARNDPRIKGMLQPTRAFGDGMYKSKLYSNLFKMKDGFQWNPPYVTVEPEITSYQIQKNDDFIVIASDGLYADLSNQDIVDCVAHFNYIQKFGYKESNSQWNAPEYLYDAQNFSASSFLLYHALIRAGRFKWGENIEDHASLSGVLSLAKGRERRHTHDDITIIVKYFLNNNNNNIQSKL